MRGRTLDDSFIILDVAQNTTREQMKMFLTRLGFNSKMVITGDITQIDLPKVQRAVLKTASKSSRILTISAPVSLMKRMLSVIALFRISSRLMQNLKTLTLIIYETTAPKTTAPKINLLNFHISHAIGLKIMKG